VTSPTPSGETAADSSIGSLAWGPYCRLRLVRESVCPYRLGGRRPVGVKHRCHTPEPVGSWQHYRLKAPREER
jgi:hypothetical protein